MHRNTISNIIIMKHAWKYTRPNIIIMKHAQKYTKQYNNNENTCIGIH